MISEHFQRSEFACKCGCGFDTVDYSLLEILEDVRWHFNKPVTVNSGCRCPNYNLIIGGSTGSQHMFGRAADITVKDTKPSEVQGFLADHDGGLGSYDTFTHIDTRGYLSRW